MNPVQQLLQKGNANGCSQLEKVADFVLTFPRQMWLEREISVNTLQTNCPEIRLQATKNITSQTWAANTGIIASAVKWTVYCVKSLLVAPLLGIGVILKKIDFSLHKEDEAYSNMLPKMAKFVELNSAKSEYENEITQINQTINTLAVAHLKTEHQGVPEELNKQIESEKQAHPDLVNRLSIAATHIQSIQNLIQQENTNVVTRAFKEYQDAIAQKS